MPLYFAYGSCMSFSDLEKTTSFEYVGTGIVFDYRLAFSVYSRTRQGGVADIVYAPGEKVEGILFEVPDFEQLDRREGHPNFYRRREIEVWDKQAKTMRIASTYEVVHKKTVEIPPSLEYANILLEGAKRLSESYQQQLQAHISSLWEKEKTTG